METKIPSHLQKLERLFSHLSRDAQWFYVRDLHNSLVEQLDNSMLPEPVIEEFRKIIADDMDCVPDFLVYANLLETQNLLEAM